MPELAQDSVALFGYLLPGFLAAWVLYGLTSDPKPSQFERVIQGLIFTFVVNALTPLVQALLYRAGAQVFALAVWDNTIRDLTRISLAIMLGAVLAFGTNKDALHRFLRNRGLTTRTAYPSEWFGVFANTVTFVVLHLLDGRRLYGWPKEWPIEADKGHFFIMEPSWIQEDGSQIDLLAVYGILIASKDVKWVEFVGEPQGVQNA